MLCLRGNSDVMKAWELLEVGSSVISRLAIDSKSDLTQLMESHPALAKRYSMLREEASSTTSDQPGHGVIRDPGRIWADGSHPTTRRHIVEQFLRDCESAIRSLPRRESFQLPFSPIQASLTASEGSKVAIVAHGMCSAALIVERDAFDFLPLPKLRLEDVEKNGDLLLGLGAERITSEGLRTKSRRNKGLLLTLRWMWESVVQSVFWSILVYLINKAATRRSH
jgi:hypothetical protein